MVKLLYKSVLDLDLWHDYFLGQPALADLSFDDYDISTTLALLPTADCVQQLKKLRWIFRPRSRGGSLFARVNEVAPDQFATQVAVNTPRRLSFWLVARDRHFANFTSLSLNPGSGQSYYFSNLSGNAGDALFLTQPLPAYTPGTEYEFGDLVVSGGNTLEAIRYQATAAASPDAALWETLANPSQYATALDLMSRQGVFYSRPIPAANPGDSFEFGLQDATGQQTFAHRVEVPDSHVAGEAIAVSLNFTGQVPGRYRLLLDGVLDDEFILFDPLSAPNPFALVEVVLNSPLVPAAFELLQASGTQTLIQPKTYVIRFKNRATRWHYRYEQPHGFQSLPPEFEEIDIDISYATIRPRGLRLQPDTLLSDGNDALLPAPSVAAIVPELDANRHLDTIFSDVHL
ncbi:hypothetical protein [Synechococcus sp. PCC 7336]|uniref:hypothetical protein n=1 Tax=Synechococcus sp. PCC 7336 TaxID=195250 RepID=UPI00034BF241|nr:hypothetical protein [Synechococcus sp. PCC 7336]